MDFSDFDQRHYPTLSVPEGYGEWVRTYEQTVLDEMDWRLLERIHTVAWQSAGTFLDLACGTGRTATWLRHKGVRSIDGVDLTPEMLFVAKDKRIHRNLVNGDITHLPLADQTYDMAIQVLADEHLRDLSPLYAEAARVTKTHAQFTLVGYHPHFAMLGTPTHFNRATGESTAIQTFVHLFSDHFRAAHSAGWRLAELDEGVIDDAWIAKKPKWDKWRNHPISFVMVWTK